MRHSNRWRSAATTRQATQEPTLASHTHTVTTLDRIQVSSMVVAILSLNHSWEQEQIWMRESQRPQELPQQHPLRCRRSLAFREVELGEQLVNTQDRIPDRAAVAQELLVVLEVPLLALQVGAHLPLFKETRAQVKAEQKSSVLKRECWEGVCLLLLSQ